MEKIGWLLIAVTLGIPGFFAGLYLTREFEGKKIGWLIFLACLVGGVILLNYTQWFIEFQDRRIYLVAVTLIGMLAGTLYRGGTRS
mgnify:CR=1 FL=1